MGTYYNCIYDANNFPSFYYIAFIMRVTTGGAGRSCPLPLPPPPFNFQTKQVPTVSVSNIRILPFTGVQKLYGPEISRFLPCMLQFLDNLRRIFIYSNYTGEIACFTLDFLKSLILNAGPSEKFFIVNHPKENHND